MTLLQDVSERLGSPLRRTWYFNPFLQCIIIFMLSEFKSLITISYCMSGMKILQEGCESQDDSPFIKLSTVYATVSSSKQYVYAISDDAKYTTFQCTLARHEVTEVLSFAWGAVLGTKGRY